MTDADNRPAVVGQVERPVRPRAWACVWPVEDGCGGGGFTTLNESAALNYMAGANESADGGTSRCRPVLVALYDQTAIDAAVAAERKRCAKLCEQYAEGIPDGCDDGARMCAAMLRRA